MAQFTDAPIFDADQHMYETPDALTRYLPERYRQAGQFVQVGKRTRIAILNRLTESIPNPTFQRDAAPGASDPLFSARNVGGKSLRATGGRAMRAPPSFR